METSVKDIVREHGSDLCGIADLARFNGAPAGFHPSDIFEACRSVVVFVKRLPKGIGLVNPRIVYNRSNDMSIFEADRIANHAALTFEDRFGCMAVPLPTDSPYDYWDEESLTGKGILSLRHAAVQAGLGSLGKNGLLITRRFGNMITIGAVLTDLALAADPLTEDLCLPRCRRCLDACPSQALDGTTTSQSRCRPHTYLTNVRGYDVINCNRCRTVCPMTFGIGDHS